MPQVHSGRALIGIAKHLTRITSVDSGLDPPRHPNPLRAPGGSLLPVVEVLPSTNDPTDGNVQHTYVAFISISVWNTLNTTSALHFHADDGIYRQVITWATPFIEPFLQSLLLPIGFNVLL